ncbi:MAG: ArnT family glycosyltransferase, partial [Acidiferrobacter sp.]
MSSLLKPRPVAAIAVFVILVLTLVPLALRPLLNLNEGLYAEVAREMLRHNLLIPRLDGLPYLEKPPLLYWLIMVSYKIFGIGKFAARLPSALAALGTLAVVLRFAKTRCSVPAWPALILFSSAGFYIMSQLAMFDMTFTFFHTITLLSFFAYMERPERPSQLMIAAAASALACLTKGLIGIVLPGLTVIVFLAIERQTIRWRPFLIAWIVFLVIALPWHIWMAIHVPDFFNRYIIQEHFDRFLGTLKPMDYRRPPLYYNFEHILLGIFPWTPFLIEALIRRRPYDKLDRFLLIWAGAYVVFFTLSQTSSSYYMLPAFPALALFIGRALPDLKGRSLPWLLAAFAFLCAAIGILALHKLHPFMRPYVVAAALVYLGFFLVILQERHPHSERLLAFAAIGSLAGFVTLALIFSITHPSRYASKNLALALIPHLTPHSYVFVAHHYEDLSSFDFYLHRTLYVFDPRQGDLYYGIRHNPKIRRLITGTALVDLVRHHRVFIAGP